MDFSEMELLSCVTAGREWLQTHNDLTAALGMDAKKRRSPWKLGVAEKDEVKAQILYPLYTGEAFRQEMPTDTRC